jgi:predicted dehydrogenase
MRLILTACIVGAMMVPAAPAFAAVKGCYERVYDAKYLRKNRKQDIVKMRFQIGVAEGEDAAFELKDRIDAGFRKRSIYAGNLVSCEADGDELQCTIDGDGGSFRVTDRGEDSLRITNTSFMRFGSGDRATSVKARGQHKEFRLFRVSEGACP